MARLRERPPGLGHRGRQLRALAALLLAALVAGPGVVLPLARCRGRARGARVKRRSIVQLSDVAYTMPMVDPGIFLVSSCYVGAPVIFFGYSYLEGEARKAGKRALIAQERVDRFQELPTVDQVELERRLLAVEDAIDDYAEKRRIRLGPVAIEIVPMLRIVFGPGATCLPKRTASPSRADSAASADGGLTTAALPPRQAPQVDAMEALPDGWSSATDERGYTYYYSVATGMSQWERPGQEADKLKDRTAELTTDALPPRP